jgi:hypothetical protein
VCDIILQRETKRETQHVNSNDAGLNMIDMGYGLKTNPERKDSAANSTRCERAEGNAGSKGSVHCKELSATDHADGPNAILNASWLPEIPTYIPKAARSAPTKQQQKLNPPSSEPFIFPLPRLTGTNV